MTTFDLPVEPTDDAVGITDTRAMILRFCDERVHWSKERAIDLGTVGDMFPTVRLHRLGIYRTRQWEFVMPTNIIQCLAVVEEDAEVLR